MTLADTEHTDEPRDGGGDETGDATVAVSESPDEPRGPRFERIWKRFPRAKLMLALAALAIVLNGLTVHQVTKVSAIDERSWIDYLVRGSKFEIAQPGDTLTPETLNELCERGADFTVFPPCTPGKPLNPKKFSYKGVNISGHSPFYFLVTGPVARLLRATPINLPPDDSLATWGRALGTVWLLLGVYFTLRIGELFDVDAKVLFLALVLIISSPALLHADTIVNPDVCAFPAGAAVLWAAVAWEKRRCRLWLVALAALVAAAFDPTNGIGVVVALAYLGVRAISTSSWKLKDRVRGEARSGPRSLARYTTAGVTMLAAALLANRGWDRLYGWLQVHVLSRPDVTDLSGNPIVKSYSLKGGGLPVRDLLGRDTLFAMFPPITDIAPPVARTGAAYLVFATITILLIQAVMVMTSIRIRFTSPVQVLTLATLVTLIAGGPALVLYNYWTGGTYDLIIARYGLSALPAIAVVLAAGLSNKVGRWTLGLAAAGLYTSALVALFV